MKLKDYKWTKISSKVFKYVLLSVTGVSIILLCSLFQVRVPVEGEYHYSAFLGSNFSLPAQGFFALTAFAAAYFYGLNPWGTGLCLVSVFPLVAIIEASVYPRSHNLIPFEIAMHFIFALPSIMMAFVGIFFRNRVAKKKIANLASRSADDNISI